MCAAWTAEGKFIDASGRSHRAQDYIRQHIRPEMSKDPATKPPEDHNRNPSIRIIAPTVAIEEGAMAGNPHTGANGQFSSYSAVWVKQGDRWLLDSVHESAASATNPLDELSWMIGQWTSTGDGPRIRCVSNWADNQKYIIREFTVEHAGNKVHSGTQRIAWDPSSATIRSWAFDSDGGISEGVWRREGNAWIVKTSGILPDGNKSSAVNFWIPEGNDRIAVKHCHAEVNGAEVEDVVHEFQRVGSGE
jgi:hypothetical protein